MLYGERHPECGCDACDESWDTEVEDLEATVLDVVGGAFREGIGAGADGPVSSWFGRAPGRERGGENSAQSVDADRLADARERLEALPDGWRAWPRRR